MAIETACHDKRKTLFFCSMNSGEMIIKIERKKEREREKERCTYSRRLPVVLAPVEMARLHGRTSTIHDGVQRIG